MSDDKKRVPFPNMIYFGDGETDVPCMKIVGMFNPCSMDNETFTKMVIEDINKLQEDGQL